MKNFPSSNGKNALIGKTGVALTRMSPLGYILIDNQQYLAVSEGLPILAEARVLVTEVKMNELIVRLHEFNHTKALSQISLPEYLNLPQLLNFHELDSTESDATLIRRILQVNALGLALIMEDLEAIIKAALEEAKPLHWTSFLNRQHHLWSWLVDTMTMMCQKIGPTNMSASLKKLMFISVEQIQLFHQITILWRGELSITLDNYLIERDLNLSDLLELKKEYHNKHFHHLYQKSNIGSQDEEELLVLIKQIDGLMFESYAKICRSHDVP